MPRDIPSFCTVTFLQRSLASAIVAIADAGFVQVEITCEPAHELAALGETELNRLGGVIERAGVRIRTVHAPMRRNVLGAPDETWRKAVVENMSRYFRLARDLGADGLVVHAVPNPIFVGETETPDLCRRIGGAVLKSLDQLVPAAEKTGVRLLLENLPYACGYPMRSTAELRAAMDDHPTQHVGLLVDVGHAALAGQDVSEEILVAGNRLLGVHLHDNDGKDDKHWVPGDGIIDWRAVRRALIGVNYAGPWTFEVNGDSIGERPERIARRTYDVAMGWQRECEDTIGV